MNTQTIEIKSLLPWSEPKRIETRNGPRLLSKASPTEAFWAVWKSGKDALKSAGVSVSKQGDAWEVCWWQPISPADVIAAQQKRDAEQAEYEAALRGEVQLAPEHEAALTALAPKLLSYQVPSVRRLVKSLTTFGGALDASDTGTGKTYTALAAAAVMGRPVFVVCPKAVIPSWRRAAAHFGVALDVCNYELLRRGEQPALKLIGTGKDEDFQWQLPANTVVIFDECHRMKDAKTWNCAMGLAALRQGYTVLGLSATAADNPLQMKFTGLLTRLFPAEKAFWSWAMKNGVTRGTWGMEFTGGRSVLDRIHRQIFPLHGTRVRIADLGDAFPETQITAQCYEVNGGADEINRIYEEMANEIARIEAKEANDRKGACILTAMLRARQRTEVLKVPAIVSMVQDAVAEGMSVAVFVNFDDTVEALMAKLKTNCVIRGGQKDEEREANIQAFQADREHVIIVNIKAGGVGVSLHGSPTSRMRLAIICPTWSGQDLKQALGRVWRANGAKSIQRIFFAAGTVEERVCKQVEEKIARIDMLNDGDLSIAGERSIVQEPMPEQPAKVETVQVTLPESKPEEQFTPEQIAVILSGLRMLAGNDPDRARDRNDIGFNAFDGEIGHALADLNTLTPRQAALGRKLVNKYRRQMPEHILKTLNIVTE